MLLPLTRHKASRGLFATAELLVYYYYFCMILLLMPYYVYVSHICVCLSHMTRSEAAGFGRHGMPRRPLMTGTALGQDGSDYSRDFATLTFDLGGHGACG